MNPLPGITLVTASFNQARYLESTIQSVLDQRYPSLQYGVVDGGSTDGSLAIIDRYRKHLSFVIVEPDRGQCDAINKGLALADGRILGWLNSDDTLLAGALATVGEHFAQFPEHGWLIGHGQRIDQEGRPLGQLRACGDFTLAGALIRDEPFNVPQPASFWRRSLWQAAGGLNESLHHAMDFDLWCRWLALGHRPTLIDRELATYREHPQSKTCSQADGFIAALIDIEKRMACRLAWRDRLRLYRKIGYQERALAIRRHGASLWPQVIRRPWWLASQQIRQAMWGRLAA